MLLKRIVERYEYEGDNDFVGRCKHIFKQPLIVGECSEIHRVRLQVSQSAPLAQYLHVPFLVNRIESLFLQMGIMHSISTLQTLHVLHRRATQKRCLLPWFISTMPRCALEFRCFLTASFFGYTWRRTIVIAVRSRLPIKRVHAKVKMIRACARTVRK